MGIENRDYFRDEGPSYNWDSGRNARGWSAVTWIIVVTAGCFVLQLMLGPRFTFLFWLLPDAQRAPGVWSVRDGAVWQFLTYAFLHDEQNIWHIVFNMWIFHMAGRDLEARRGSSELIAFYLLSAVVSGVAVFGWELLIGRGAPAVGASGAVSAILMVFAFTYPRAEIRLFGVLPMKMLTFAIGVILLDSIPMLMQLAGRARPEDQVAHSAHLGGIIFGILYQRNGWRVLNWLPGGMGLSGVKQLFRKKPQLRVHRPVEPDVGPSGPEFDRRVDELLEKVARSGEACLTDEERELLIEASRRARSRRSM